jgi:hypothetical protein
MREKQFTPSLLMQTLSPSEAMQRAKPLTQQRPVNKGKVWLLLCGGAAGLFAATLLVENWAGLFPAVARANQAMAAQKGASEEKLQEQDSVSTEVAVAQPEARKSKADMQARSEQAVLEGLKVARERVTEERQ